MLIADTSILNAEHLPMLNLSLADYAAALEQVGLPGPFAAILADSDARAGEGALFDASGTLSRLIGRPTTPWRATIAAGLPG